MDASPESKPVISQWILFLAIVLAVLIVASPILTYPMGRDQGMYANIGNTILQGGIPFVDMWDIKPPPIYYIYATGIAIFGTGTEAIRAIDLTLVPLGMLGLYLLVSQMKNQRVGLFTALLYGVFYFNDGFQNLSQSDSLATIPAIWIAYATFRASNSDPASKSALIASLTAGLISGLLLWFKPQQYALIVGAFILYHLIARLKSPGRTTQALSLRKIFLEGFAFAIGGLITGGALLAYFWSQGIIQEIFIVAEGTAAYNAQGYDFNEFIANMRQGFYFRWIVWHGLIILTGLWIARYFVSFIGSARRHSPTNPVRDNDSRLLILWMVSGLGFAFMQAKGFDTHWFPILPPMAIMGAIVTDAGIARFQADKVRLALSITLVIGLLAIPLWTGRTAWAYIAGQTTRYDYWDTFQANDVKPEQSLVVVNFLRERVAPGDSLYIWGFRPEVYFMSGLRPATRYQAHFPLVAPWYPLEWQQENVDILWAAMPPYALILEDDFMPPVTDFDADSHTLLQDYTELNNWLIANYERETQIGDFIIWRRRTP